MKPPKRTVNIIKHLPTGAHVPIVVDEVKEGIIKKYHETVENRKGFSVEMLMQRWGKSKDEVVNLLQTYRIPAHVSHTDIKRLSGDALPLDVAFFFDEYIFALEKKYKLGHVKLKSKTLDDFRKSIRNFHERRFNPKNS